MFSATIDAKEIDLINAVAKAINPMAFYYGEYRGTPAEQACAKSCDEANRQTARTIAVEVIGIVRAHSNASRDCAIAEPPGEGVTP